MSKVFKKKLKDQLVDVSVIDMLKEVGTLRAEILLKVVKYKDHEWFAIMIRGKEENGNKNL